VQRIVAALMAERLVMTGPRGRRILLGPEIADLAQQSRRNVAEACRLVLTELSQATGETADLSILQGDAMIFIDQIPGLHRLRTVSSVGDAFPLTTTANGLACLAQLPAEDAETLARAEWSRWGAAPDVAAFKQRLAEVRESGLAHDLDDHTEGISAVGVAFRDRAGGLYAISVPVPSPRFPEVRELVESALLKSRQHAQQLMAEE
jgi:DNA-binding IclR family transcriptional regulator